MVKQIKKEEDKDANIVVIEDNNEQDDGEIEDIDLGFKDKSVQNLEQVEDDIEREVEAKKNQKRRVIKRICKWFLVIIIGIIILASISPSTMDISEQNFISNLAYLMRAESYVVDLEPVRFKLIYNTNIKNKERYANIKENIDYLGYRNTFIHNSTLVTLNLKDRSQQIGNIIDYFHELKYTDVTRQSIIEAYDRYFSYGRMIQWVGYVELLKEAYDEFKVDEYYVVVDDDIIIPSGLETIVRFLASKNKRTDIFFCDASLLDIYRINSYYKGMNMMIFKKNSMHKILDYIVPTQSHSRLMHNILDNTLNGSDPASLDMYLSTLCYKGIFKCKYVPFAKSNPIYSKSTYNNPYNK